MFNYDIQAKPTSYQGRVYRSRHEARWAALFTMMGWTFEYEPFDLDGWTPDFLLKTTVQNMLVEIKPTPAAMADAVDKCFENSFGLPVLLCCDPNSRALIIAKGISRDFYFGDIHQQYWIDAANDVQFLKAS